MRENSQNTPWESNPNLLSLNRALAHHARLLREYVLVQKNQTFYSGFFGFQLHNNVIFVNEST